MFQIKTIELKKIYLLVLLI